MKDDGREYSPLAASSFKTEISDSELRDNVSVNEIDPNDEEGLRNYFQFRYENYKDAAELASDASPETMYQTYKATLEACVPLDTPGIKYDETKYHQSLIHEIRDTEGNILAGGQINIYTKRNRKEAVLYGNAVDPQYRGRNLSPLLIEVALDKATKAGCVQASSGVFRTNSSALRSALKGSFRVIYDHSREESMEDYYSVRGNYFLTKMLGPDADTQTQAEENLSYETRSIPLTEEDQIIDALKDGWEGYDVEKFDPAATDAKPVIILRKASEL